MISVSVHAVMRMYIDASAREEDDTEHCVVLVMVFGTSLCSMRHPLHSSSIAYTQKHIALGFCGGLSTARLAPSGRRCQSSVLVLRRRRCCCCSLSLSLAVSLFLARAVWRERSDWIKFCGGILFHERASGRCAARQNENTTTPTTTTHGCNDAYVLLHILALYVEHKTVSVPSLVVLHGTEGAIR